jgi:ribosomal protein L3 glutamine methyltransferase
MDALPGEYRHEPALAFAGGASGLDFINRLMDQARDHLTDDGLLVVEAGSAREPLEALWPRTPFTWLMSENGEAVVFALEAAELVSSTCQSA